MQLSPCVRLHLLSEAAEGNAATIKHSGDHSNESGALGERGATFLGNDHVAQLSGDVEYPERNENIHCGDEYEVGPVVVGQPDHEILGRPIDTCSPTKTVKEPSQLAAHNDRDPCTIASALDGGEGAKGHQLSHRPMWTYPTRDERKRTCRAHPDVKLQDVSLQRDLTAPSKQVHVALAQTLGPVP